LLFTAYVGAADAAGSEANAVLYLPLLDRPPLDKKHPRQPTFAERVAEDSESKKRNEHQ
jgi:hypothetical protein